MSVSLFREGIQVQHVGRTCPKCGNGSVFENRKYKFFGLIYDYTIEECEMSKQYCDYQNLQYRRDYLINKILEK